MKNIIVIAVIVLVGCAAHGLDVRRQELIRQGQPPPYVDGHVDGCSSGTAAAGNPYYRFAKNVQRFEADKLYAQGWNDGFAICKAQYESTTRLLR